VNQRAVKKQETRQRILKAAAAMASREGLHAAEQDVSGQRPHPQ
jgi:AcrR family transcriptional regulator